MSNLEKEKELLEKMGFVKAEISRYDDYPKSPCYLDPESLLRAYVLGNKILWHANIGGYLDAHDPNFRIGWDERYWRVHIEGLRKEAVEEDNTTLKRAFANYKTTTEEWRKVTTPILGGIKQKASEREIIFVRMRKAKNELTKMVQKIPDGKPLRLISKELGAADIVLGTGKGQYCIRGLNVFPGEGSKWGGEKLFSDLPLYDDIELILKVEHPPFPE